MYGRHRNGLGIDPATGTGTVIGSDGKEYKIGPRAELAGAQLAYCNLMDAHLEGANLEGASLCDANLYGAVLYHAILREANLEGANLMVASLRCANLTGANLRGADLQGTDLAYAELSYADLTGANLDADLEGASLLSTVVDPQHVPFIEAGVSKYIESVFSILGPKVNGGAALKAPTIRDSLRARGGAADADLTADLTAADEIIEFWTHEREPINRRTPNPGQGTRRGPGGYKY